MGRVFHKIVHRCVENPALWLAPKFSLIRQIETQFHISRSLESRVMPGSSQSGTTRRLRLAAAAPRTPPLSPELLRRLYVLMRTYREAGAGSNRLRPREALIAAAALELRADDVLACVAKDPALTVMAGMHIPSANFVSLADVGASSLLLVAGLALTCARASKSVVIVVADARLMRSRRWHETALIAAERKLPAIFIFDFPPAARRLSHAYRFPAIPVDATDAVALHRVLHEAAEHARKGHGPTLVQCLRLPIAANAAHRSGAADGDPVASMERCLRQFGLWSDDLLTAGA